MMRKEARKGGVKTRRRNCTRYQAFKLQRDVVFLENRLCFCEMVGTGKLEIVCFEVLCNGIIWFGDFFQLQMRLK